MAGPAFDAVVVAEEDRHSVIFQEPPQGLRRSWIIMVFVVVAQLLIRFDVSFY
jgi:hypothetical protein